MTIFSASLLPNSFLSATTSNLSFPSRNPSLSFSGSIHFSGHISANRHHHRSMTTTTVAASSSSSSSSEHIPTLISVLEESLLKHDAICNQAIASLLAKQYVDEAKLPSDPKFWTEEAIDAIIAQITRLQVALVTLAVKNEGVIVMAIDPELNREQPVLLEHLLLAYIEQLDWDVRHLVDCRTWLTHSTFGVALGEATDKFSQPSETTTYWGLLSAISIMAMHLTRIIRSQWVAWSSDNFGIITLSEPVLTGQLDNVLEDVLALRATSSNARKTSGKEQKELVFGSVKTAIRTMEVFSNFARNIQYNKDIMLKKGLPARYAADTLAEDLVLKINSFDGPWSVAAQLKFWIKRLNIDVSPSFSVVSDRKGDKEEPDGPSGQGSVDDDQQDMGIDKLNINCENI